MNTPTEICEHCGAKATHDWNGLTCWPCVVSSMEHGHQHVHDDHRDCVADVERLDGTGTDQVRCPSPIQAEGDGSQTALSLGEIFTPERAARAGDPLRPFMLCGTKVQPDGSVVHCTRTARHAGGCRP